MTVSLVRAFVLGFGGVASLGSVGLVWLSINGCEPLNETSLLPTADAELDVGAIPPLPEEAAPPLPLDAGPPVAAARIRLANLLQGAGAVDLCSKRDEATAPWEAAKISTNPNAPKDEGSLFGEVSAHIFLPVATAGSAGQRYLFRIVALGAPCEGEAAAPLASIPATVLRQSGAATLAVVGIVGEPGVDAGDPNPRGVAAPDTLTPSVTSASIRVFHGAPDLPALDVIFNGELALTGVRYGNTIPFPYTSTTGGFASLPAGVPEGSILTLKAGTTSVSYTIPERIRRATATTIFVSGSAAAKTLQVSLCSDRSPPEGSTLAACTKLQAVAE